MRDFTIVWPVEGIKAILCVCTNISCKVVNSCWFLFLHIINAKFNYVWDPASFGWWLSDLDRSLVTVFGAHTKRCIWLGCSVVLSRLKHKHSDATNYIETVNKD